MTNFNFMSLLLIMLIVRNGILILGMCCMLLAIRLELNRVSHKINFKVFLITILHPMLYYSVINKMDNNKFEVISLFILLALITDWLRYDIKNDMDYLMEKYGNKKDKKEDVE